MSHPGTGPDLNPSGQQPGQPGQRYQPFEQQQGQPARTWTPPQGGASPFGEPPKKRGLKKVLPIVGGVVGAGVAGAGGLGRSGMGEPEAGDGVKGATGADVEPVDCSSDEAEAKGVGVEKEEMTYS